MRPPGSFKIARRNRSARARAGTDPADTACRRLPLSDEDRSQRDRDEQRERQADREVAERDERAVLQDQTNDLA